MNTYDVTGTIDLANTVEGSACVTVEAADIPTAVQVVVAAFAQVGIRFDPTAVSLQEDE